MARPDDDLLVGAVRRRFHADRSASAQQAKYERILAELALPAGAHILEIGCGWGGFAEVAARAGYRVTGLSLSDAQTAYARERIARAGLADRVTLARPGLPRRARDLRRRGVDRDVRGGRREVLARVLRDGAARARAGRPRVRPDDHHRRRALRALPHAIRLHPAVHLSGRDARVAVAFRRRGRARRIRRRARCTRSAATTRKRSRAGSRRSTPTPARCARRASTSASSAAGGSISPTASPGFASGSTDVAQYTLVAR